jgi:hypothetical protein
MGFAPTFNSRFSKLSGFTHGEFLECTLSGLDVRLFLPEIGENLYRVRYSAGDVLYLMYPLSAIALPADQNQPQKEVRRGESIGQPQNTPHVAFGLGKIPLSVEKCGKVESRPNRVGFHLNRASQFFFSLGQTVELDIL